MITEIILASLASKLLTMMVGPSLFISQAEVVYGPQTSQMEACRQAEERAKVQIVEKAFGQLITADNDMVCRGTDDESDCSMRKFTWEHTEGSIKSIRDKKIQATANSCKVTVAAEVQKEELFNDPNFDVRVLTNRKVYHRHDEVKIHIEPNNNMYVTVFHWKPDGDKMNKVFPNRFDTNNKFSSKFAIPTNDNYQIRFKTDKKVSDEYLIVVATKDLTNFLGSYTPSEFSKTMRAIKEKRVVKKPILIMKGDIQ